MAEMSCASCGKETENLKACTACKLVKYCGRECQVAHRSMHKKTCKKKAAELFDAQLFSEPPARSDCPICCRMLPLLKECSYHSCCGQYICAGCRYFLPREHCPFCNTVAAMTDEACRKQLLDRIEKFNDPMAMNVLGCDYNSGRHGLTVDYSKANQLFQRAIDLGCGVAHYNLGNSYYQGRGIEQNMKKAKHHWQMAAIMGDVISRHNLGSIEARGGNVERAMKHFVISAKCGNDESLEEVKNGYMRGLVGKDDFENALRAHQAYQNEINSEQRDRARADFM